MVLSDPVKLHQYFEMSVGQFEVTTLSTGSSLAEVQDVAIFNVF